MFVYRTKLWLTVWLCGVRELKRFNFKLRRANSFIHIFVFIAKSSKTNWRCYNEELWLNYPLNPALRIAFVPVAQLTIVC